MATRSNPELPGLLGSGHEVHRPPCSRLVGVAQLAPIDHLGSLPSLRLPVRHDCTRLSEGHLGLRRRHRYPRSAFFCSNRYSHQGCGRTFSVHWATVIPRCSLPTLHLLELLSAIDAGNTVHGAWAGSSIWISLSTAYRWLTRWKLGTARIRARLCQVRPPPSRADILPDLLSLRHFRTAFPDAACPVAAFQAHFQMAVFG